MILRTSELKTLSPYAMHPSDNCVDVPPHGQPEALELWELNVAGGGRGRLDKMVGVPELGEAGGGEGREGRTWLPYESRCSILPDSMMEQVSKPRCGWSGNPATISFGGAFSSSSIRKGSCRQRTRPPVSG